METIYATFKGQVQRVSANYNEGTMSLWVNVLTATIADATKTFTPGLLLDFSWPTHNYPKNRWVNDFGRFQAGDKVIIEISKKDSIKEYFIKSISITADPVLSFQDFLKSYEQIKKEA